MTEAPERTWYVTTAWFKDGGKWVSGPYSTCEDAITARETIEQIANRKGDFWVDSKVYGHSAPAGVSP